MYRANMGPRGRMNGHRGFRSDIFLGIMGLFFFGWIILAAVGGMVGAGIMILSSVISWLASVVPAAVRGLLSSEGFAIGVVLGLVWYFRTHRRNTKETPQAEASRESAGTIDETPVQTEIAEAPACRTFNA